MKYQKSLSALTQIGRELHVDYVLDGQVQRVGDLVQVTAKLFGIREDKLIWSEKFEQKFTDIVSLQESISERVARAMT